ncbi:MAG: PSD1 and planctomycete cytochrome C domain-containing protein, partial [Gemmataceae bacterium]|nr:PSD1 and planctomycete cytochrome C domain-containing protein [Gemmataceae bacterium]
MRRVNLGWSGAALVLLCCLSAPGRAADDHFEKHVRPLLVEKCQSCHGAEKTKGGLRLDSRAALLKGGDSGPVVVPGKPAVSLLVKAIGYTGELKMPPKGKLSDTEIALLSHWIESGAVWPDSRITPKPGAEFAVTKKQRDWWAFQPVKRPDVQKVAPQPVNPLDAFIRAKLDAAGLKPAAPADKRTLLRRVTFDLTGLPPTPEEVDAFLKDDSPEAFAKVVDRLLDLPTYGQRWARHWLDVVRYADYHDGNPKARNPVCEPLEAWRYRDWVVRSLNSDLPFDRFIAHQIAGDLLPPPDGKQPYPDGLVATTFLVNGAWDRGDADKEKMVSDMVDDQIDTVGKAFLGLTLGCARCHDHKFDPVSTRDYYALAGIFYSTRMLKELGTKGGEITLQRRPLVSQEVLDKRSQQLKQIAELNANLAELDKKNPMPPANDPTRELLIETRNRVQKELPPEPPLALAVSEGSVPGGLFPKIQDVPIHVRGSYTRLGLVVPRGMPTFFAGDKQPQIATGSGRKELADWVASKDNPLTARVIVNRVWQWHFGTGLVRTPNNFGLLSEPPSHPELLDWLAATFVADCWSFKKLHRRILLSEAYQRSSAAIPDALTRDPDNRWLGRFTPRRLEAEAIRDAMLAVTGRLDLKPLGPATHDLGVPNRSLYVQTARWDRSNFATLFDAANPDAAVEKRDVSTVAPQALFLLNHEFVVLGAVFQRVPACVRAQQRING